MSNRESSSSKGGGKKIMKKQNGQPATVVFTGGKGGVGKSFVAANLGVLMSRLGHEVVLVDALRWGYNLHTLIGMPRPERDVTSLEDGEVSNFADLLTDTPYDHLKLVCGLEEKSRLKNEGAAPALFEDLNKLDCEYCLIDMGGYISFSLLDHVLASSMPVIVTVPEPTAMERTYEFLKSLYYRLLRNGEHELGFDGLVDKVMLESRKLGVKTPKNLMETISFFEPKKGEMLSEYMKQMRLQLVLNQVRSNAENLWGNGICSLCNNYFGLEMDYLGPVEYEGVVADSVRRRQPLHVLHPEAQAAKDIERIAHRMISRRNSTKKG